MLIQSKLRVTTVQVSHVGHKFAFWSMSITMLMVAKVSFFLNNT